MPGDFQSDAYSQRLKKAAPHHMVACYDDACVHWVPADEAFHWYHNSCHKDAQCGTDYLISLELLRKHMDACGGLEEASKELDPEVIRDGV